MELITADISSIVVIILTIAFSIIGAVSDKKKKEEARERKRLRDLDNYVNEKEDDYIDLGFTSEDYAVSEDSVEEGTSDISMHSYEDESYSKGVEVDTAKVSVKDRIKNNKKDFILFGEILKPKF